MVSRTPKEHSTQEIEDASIRFFRSNSQV